MAASRHRSGAGWWKSPCPDLGGPRLGNRPGLLDHSRCASHAVTISVISSRAFKKVFERPAALHVDPLLRRAAPSPLETNECSTAPESVGKAMAVREPSP